LPSWFGTSYREAGGGSLRPLNALADGLWA